MTLCRPELIDPERYNWEKDSWAVAQFCPEKIDPIRYKEFSNELDVMEENSENNSVTLNKVRNSKAVINKTLKVLLSMLDREIEIIQNNQ